MKSRLALVLATLAVVVLGAVWGSTALGSATVFDRYHAVGPLASSSEQTGTTTPLKSTYYYFWMSRTATASVNVSPAYGAGLTVSIYRYFAGFDDWRVPTPYGLLNSEQTVVSGLYFIEISQTGKNPIPYSLRVESEALTATPTANTARPRALRMLGFSQGRNKTAAVPVSIGYDYMGFLSGRDIDWYRFRVLSKSDVWIGEGASNLSQSLIVGEILNSRLVKVASLRTGKLNRTRLAAGTYYVRWHTAPSRNNIVGSYRFGIAGKAVRSR